MKANVLIYLIIKIYGFTTDRSFILREVQTGFGLMRGGITSNLGKEMLPIAGADEVDCRRDLTESDTGCYLAGDIRANEQVLVSCVFNPNDERNNYCIIINRNNIKL